MSKFILLFLFPIVRTQECVVSTSIANWLKNNTGSCTVVKGNFILDKKADNRVDQLYEVFTNLTRIEGCLSVKGFTGRKNLHFLSKLQEVICNKTIAKSSNLKNVIQVEGPELDEMGFNSLKTVKGPGNIVLLYDEEQSSVYDYNFWDNSYFGYYQNLYEDEEGNWKQKRCFSKEEIVFLAYHPQFNGTMYPPCDTDDPCMRADIFNKHLLFEEIPTNCTVYVGPVCMFGLYRADDEALQKFHSVKVIVGELKVAGTLLDNLYSVFPNLEAIYPYNIPSAYLDINHAYQIPCNDVSLVQYDRCLQQVNVGLNRFLTDISLPRLRPIRPIDVSVPIDDQGPSDYHQQWNLSALDIQAFLPDTIHDHCSFFPQFKKDDCGFLSQLGGNYSSAITLYEEIFVFETWIIAMICVAIGLILSLRAIILLQFSSASKCLPYSRNFMVLVMLITSLVAVESCIVYQKTFQIYDATYDESRDGFSSFLYSHFSESRSFHLTRPLFLNFILILAWSKHACLALIILSYIDIIIYYRYFSRRFSQYFCILAGIIAIGLCVYLQSQLVITIRGRSPNYNFDQQPAFMPFVLSADYLEDFNRFVPQTRVLAYSGGWLNFAEDFFDRYYMREKELRFHEIPFEIHGYLQLSMNRIRFFILDVLLRRYCGRQQFQLCFVPNSWGKEYTVDNEEWMTENTWRLVEKIVEKLPYLFYPIVSLSCYNFARYQHYLGAALNYRVTMEEERKKSVGISHASEISDL